MQVIATYDPEVVAISGPISWDREHLQIEMLREAVGQYGPSLARPIPPLVPSHLGADGTLAGAATLVLQDVFCPPLADHSQSPANRSRATSIRRRAGTMK